MSESFAACSFCSRRDPSVTVICEGRCLMCHRCQCSGNIRKLLVDATDMGVDVTGSDADPECPLCELAFVPPMLAAIRVYRRDLNNNAKVVEHLNMGMAPLPLHTLIEKVLRGNRGEGEGSSGVNTNPSAAPQRNPDAEKTVTIAELTPQSVLALFLDVVVDMWDDYRRNNMEPISICTVRQINRRKTTTINKEYRLRNLLDMIGRASWELEGKVDAHIQASTNGALFLFSRLVGLRPKPQTSVRPCHGVLATTLLVMMTNDSCIKAQRILSNDNKPSAEEARTKFGKFAYKPMPVRRLINALRALFACDEPHWTCSPLKAVCTEFSIPLPWGAAAVSRMLHCILSLCAFPDTPREAKAASDRASSFAVPSAQDQRKKHGADMRGNLLTRMRALEKRAALTYQSFRGESSADPNPAPEGGRLAGQRDSSARGRSSSSGRPTSPSRQSLSPSRGGTPVDTPSLHSYKPHYATSLSWEAAYDQAGALTCDIFLLVAIAIECWENEVSYVIATMARSMMNAQRRGGMVGAYTEASGALNVEERTALRRLARHYLDVNRERVTKERADVTLQAAQDEADRLQAIEDEKAAGAKAARKAARNAKNKPGTGAGAGAGAASDVPPVKKAINTSDMTETQVAAMLAAVQQQEAAAEAESVYQAAFVAQRARDDEAWFAAKELQVWVDWSECRDTAAHRQFSFAVPESLMARSDVQLQVHLDATLKEVRLEETTEDMDDWPDYGLHDFDYFPLFGYPDGLKVYADDGSTASKQNLTMMFDGVDVNMALPGGAIVDGGSVSTYDNGSIGDLVNPGIPGDIVNDMARNEDRFSRISQRLRTSLPVLPHNVPGYAPTTEAGRQSLTQLPETDKPLRVLSALERHLLTRSLPDAEADVMGTVGLKSLRETARVAGVRMQHRTPSSAHLVPSSVDHVAPRAPPGALDGPTPGKHKVGFVDLLSKFTSAVGADGAATGPALTPQSVLTKTGLIPEMSPGVRWDEKQFEKNLERISALSTTYSHRPGAGAGAGAGHITGSGAAGAGNVTGVGRSESEPVLPGPDRRAAAVGKDALSLSRLRLDHLAQKMAQRATLTSSASAGQLFVPFDSDAFGDADVDYDDYDEGFYEQYSITDGHDVEALSQERAVKRLTRGLFRDDNSDNSLNPLSAIASVELGPSEADSGHLEELSIGQGTDPFAANNLYNESVDGHTIITNSADGGSLIDRALAPVGSQSRAKLDMSHYTTMRPSELPRVSERGVQMLVLRDSKLGASDKGLATFGGAVERTCVGPRSAALRMLDLGGNALGFKGAHVFGNAVVKGNQGSGLPLLEVMCAPENDLKDTGARVLVDAVLGSGGSGGALVKLDLRSNALLLSEALSGSLARACQLRVLDLSWNGITLVSKGHIAAFSDCLAALPALQVFSMAYNRIQDKGATVICETLVEHCSDLKVLDLSYCFLAAPSVPSLELLLKLPQEHPLKVLLLFGIVLNREQKDTLATTAAAADRRVVRTGHHTGIELIEDYFYEPAAPEEVLKGPKHTCEGGSVVSTVSHVSSASGASRQ